MDDDLDCVCPDYSQDLGDLRVANLKMRDDIKSVQTSNSHLWRMFDELHDKTKGMTDMNNDVKRLDGIIYRVLLYFVCLNVVLLTIIGLTGCNTIAGIGKDMQAVAQCTQDWLADEPSTNRNYKGN